MGTQLDKVRAFGGALWDYYVVGSRNYFFPKTDLVRDRILFDGGVRTVKPAIAWPAGLGPLHPSAPKGTKALPQCDVMIVTWTAAEARALADVLSPGIESSDWVYYTTNFAAYEKQLTGRSPARESKRLGSWATVQIGPSKVLLFKSELHPATDASSLPTAQMITQVAKEAGVGYIVTTGTAGGAGDGTRLGDVNVASSIRADFTTKLKGRPWSNMTWATAMLTPSQQHFLGVVPAIVPVPLYPVSATAASYGPPPTVWFGDVVSTDFFAFDSGTDGYHLRQYDPLIRAVEMDDAAVGIGAAAAVVPCISVRNASDPVMPDITRASANAAAKIYQKWGYDTTVNSAVASWAVVAGLPGEM